MTTKMIGIKEFRKNFTAIWKHAHLKDIRYIVMNHSVPVLEVLPLKKKKETREEFIASIKEAREQFKRGEYYTQEEMMKEFGITP
ncbi:MAG: hypothetical protein WC873_00865 [Candidatus Gracilibacteria bacterium]